MNKYICSVCGFVYDEKLGSPDYGVNPNTKWENLPDDWVCPWCAAPKSDFYKEETNKKEDKQLEVEEIKFEGKLNSLELSVLFSNLSRGFEKSYKPKEQKICFEISEYYKEISNKIDGTLEDLLKLIEDDLDNAYPNAMTISKNDRGALRALVWSEKVTKILKSILSRYDEDNIKDNDIYVCSICGFIYIGNDLAEICPVCKVSNWKFEKIGVR